MSRISNIRRIYNKFENISVPLGYAMGVAGFVFLFKGGDKWKWFSFVAICIITVLVSFLLALIEILREKNKLMQSLMKT